MSRRCEILCELARAADRTIPSWGMHVVHWKYLYDVI
jgi:hypothetical protein